MFYDMAESLAWEHRGELPTEDRHSTRWHLTTSTRRSPPTAARLAPTGLLLLRKTRTGHGLRALVQLPLFLPQDFPFLA